MPPFANSLSETALFNPRRRRKLISKLQWLPAPFVFITTYWFWVVGVRLLTLTLITYFIISPTSRFQDISDAFSSNEVSLMGLSALFYTGLLYGLNPLTQTTLSEIVSREKIEKQFLPGFIQGAILSGGIIILFVVAGVYRHLGYYIPLEEAPIELANIILRMATLAILAYCEEFIFRHKFSNFLIKHLPQLAAFNITALVYCVTKCFQFNLGVMHTITLYLISIALSYRCFSSAQNQFAKGAGFWAAVLIVFQPILSLPIFGNDFSGILLIKYQTTASGILPQSQTLWQSGLGNTIPLNRFLSGGIGGPLASFIFQLLLILDIGRNILRRKKPTT
jgi:hypothetical protein